MARKSPKVSDFMTRLPEEVDRRVSLARAGEIMREHGIHHLPVMDGPRLYGILSARDVEVLTAALGDGGEMPIGAVCVVDPYTVGPTASLHEVAEVMAQRRIGSAVIVDADVVVGIFTVTDALRALASAYR